MGNQGRLTRRGEFSAVQAHGRRVSDQLLVLKTLPNQHDTSRFGLVVSKRVGNAVARNRCKRRLREVLRQEQLPAGWDLVLAARPAIGQASFAAIQQSVRDLLRRAALPERPAGAPHTGGGER